MSPWLSLLSQVPVQTLLSITILSIPTPHIPMLNKLCLYQPSTSETYLQEAPVPSLLTEGCGVGRSQFGAWLAAQSQRSARDPLTAWFYVAWHLGSTCPVAVRKEQILKCCPEPTELESSALLECEQAQNFLHICCEIRSRELPRTHPQPKAGERSLEPVTAAYPMRTTGFSPSPRQPPVNPPCPHP